MKCAIGQGQVIPQWYGVAYREFNRQVVICYPIPFNLIARWWHNLMMKMKYPTPAAIERLLHDESLRWRRTYPLAEGTRLREQVKREASEDLLRKHRGEGWADGRCSMMIEVIGALERNGLVAAVADLRKMTGWDAQTERAMREKYLLGQKLFMQ